MNLEAQNLVFLKFFNIGNFHASLFTKSIFSALNSATEFQIGMAKVRIMQREPIVIVINALGKR